MLKDGDRIRIGPAVLECAVFDAGEKPPIRDGDSHPALFGKALEIPAAVILAEKPPGRKDAVTRLLFDACLERFEISDLLIVGAPALGGPGGEARALRRRPSRRFGFRRLSKSPATGAFEVDDAGKLPPAHEVELYTLLTRAVEQRRFICRDIFRSDGIVGPPGDDLRPAGRTSALVVPTGLLPVRLAADDPDVRLFRSPREDAEAIEDDYVYYDSALLATSRLEAASAFPPCIHGLFLWLACRTARADWP